MSIQAKTMKDLVASIGQELVPIKPGELFEVKILKIFKNKILVDVGGYSLGIIPEQEFSPEINDLKEGQLILAYVLTQENDDGYVIFSLKRADKERIVKLLQNKLETGQVLEVKATGANKGGLLCQFGEYDGFLPVSHLSTTHYPKVAAGDREEILNRLKKLIGQTFQIKILNFEPNAGKLIFSEKAAGDILQKEKISQINIGEKLTGEIMGIVDFGLFVKVKTKSGQEEIEGLVHISEVSWDHINDLRSQFKVGQKIEVEVISTENNRLSLSIKKLLPDPWLKDAKKFSIGQLVDGQVTKITPFGAFVKISQLDGLVHISEMGDKITDPRQVVEEGRTYQFKIVSLEPELHKLSLSMKDLDAKNLKDDKKKIDKEKPVKKIRKNKGAKK